LHKRNNKNIPIQVLWSILHLNILLQLLFYWLVVTRKGHWSVTLWGAGTVG
jgi:hypothetical protein